MPDPREQVRDLMAANAINAINRTTSAHSSPTAPVLDSHSNVSPSSFALEVVETPDRELQKRVPRARSLRGEPLYEFFALLLLSQKVIHGKVGAVCRLQASPLYEHATKVERLGFHRYHDFIEQRVQTMVRDDLFRKHKRKQRERDLRL
jgi:hypothetical protein